MLYNKYINKTNTVYGGKNMKSLKEKLLHWALKSKKKKCGKCCLTCKYYDTCKNDNE